MRSAKAARRTKIIVGIFILWVIVGLFVVGRTGAMALWVGGALPIIAVLILYFLWKNQEEKMEVLPTDRFYFFLSMMGSSEASVRKEAIYSLHELAFFRDEFRWQVADFLCTYIRSRTVEPQYQDAYRAKSSIDVQTAIDVLFKNQDGLYRLFDKFGAADLSGAYLVGADFSYAWCPFINLTGTDCRDAIFWHANFIGADFEDVILQRAHFSSTRCQGATFRAAQCQEARFDGNFSGAEFAYAQCQKADFRGGNFTGAYFLDARCQGAYFCGSRFHGALFLGTHCEYADFEGAEFHGAFALRGSFPVMSDRIGKDTEIKTMVLSGELYEKAIHYFSDWHEDLRRRRIVPNRADDSIVCGAPDGIITGVLEDTPELRNLIKELDEIEKQRSKQCRRRRWWLEMPRRGLLHPNHS